MHVFLMSKYWIPIANAVSSSAKLTCSKMCIKKKMGVKHVRQHLIELQIVLINKIIIMTIACAKGDFQRKSWNHCNINLCVSNLFHFNSLSNAKHPFGYLMSWIKNIVGVCITFYLYVESCQGRHWSDPACYVFELLDCR